MENKDEIIEVEVTDEKLNAPKKEDKPKKTLDDYSSKIRFYGSLAYLGSRYGFTGMILAGLAGLVFSILYSENKATSFLALVIVCFSFCLLFAIFYVVGLIAKSLARKYMAKDPNYQDKV